jgi:CRISPR-associated protein Cas5h
MLDGKRVLIFDLSGPFAHYKKIFATTTALTYPLPPKTSLYGLVAAILGLEKEGNAYLDSFREGSCRLAIRLMRPVASQRLTMNLRPSFGSLRKTENRKPTLMEFVDRPHYRIYFTHTDDVLYDRLKHLLERGQSVYTPTLGLANLIAKVTYVGEGMARREAGEDVDSVVPKRTLEKLLPPPPGRNTRLMEVGQYAVEMLPSRDVTVRENIVLDRAGLPIAARVSECYRIEGSPDNSSCVFF